MSILRRDELPAENKYQLPLFVDESRLPTTKNHISYSEISDWMDCSYRHKLKFIDKIDLDKPSIHTINGHVLHWALEHFLKTKVMKTHEEILTEFRQGINELLTVLIDKNQSEFDKVLASRQEFEDNLPDMIGQVPGWINENFPGWSFVSAEQKLFEPVDGQKNIRFKGFIDSVIKVPVRSKRRRPDQGEFEYWIIDFKTCSWGWKIEQKRSFQKQLQLILYKHYLSQVLNINLKDIKCAFLLVKRTVKKSRTPYDRVELVPVSVGPKSIEKAIQTQHSMLNQIRKKIALKNKSSCEPFCPYKFTKHCF